jgi:RNA polymerase sigma-70 factor (ECF subfamily)
VEQTVGVHPDHDLERLYREEGPRLYWALLAYVGDREIASDACAEAFAQALARGSELRAPLNWIWTVAFRVAAGELKRRGKLDPPIETPYESPEPSDLVAALAKLSERQRACVILHHYAGYPLKEIGSILGLAKATVGVHLTRGRRRLRELLEANDE